MTEQPKEKYVTLSGGNGTLDIGKVIQLQQLDADWKTFYERWEVLEWDTTPMYTWTGAEVKGELKYEFSTHVRVKIRKISDVIEA